MSKSKYLDRSAAQRWQGLRQVHGRAIIFPCSLPDSHEICCFFCMASYKEASCPEYLPPCESAMLSLETELWQRHGAVSRALIKHSSFIVAPRSLLFSQKRGEQTAATLQPSHQLDKSQHIPVTRRQGSPSPHARGWGAVQTFSFQSLCQRGPLGQSRFYNSCLFSLVFTQIQVGSTCN